MEEEGEQVGKEGEGLGGEEGLELELWVEREEWLGGKMSLVADVDVGKLEEMKRPEVEGMVASVGETECPTSASIAENHNVNPPTEDWLQCQECQKWFHEACGNAFNVCDMCDG